MIVLDTSAAVEIIRLTKTGLALRELMLSQERAISCDLFRVEAANVFRKFTRAEHLSTEQAEAYYRDTLKLVDEFHPIEELQNEAFRESIRLNHSTYDMFYFVLARRTGGTLFTLDHKLMQLCLDQGVNCVQEFDLNNPESFSS